MCGQGCIKRCVVYCRNDVIQEKISERQLDGKKMGEAIQKVKSRELTLREASTTYEIPRATLGQRVLGRNKIAKDAQKHLGR